MNNVVIIMTKVPRAGNVKTRLQPFLSPSQCAALSGVFLEDTVNKAQKVADQLIIAFSPDAERDYFTKFDDQNFVLVPQKGENLGDRMSNAFQFAFTEKPDSVVMIGTDSPNLPAEIINSAFENLQAVDVVLGESEDGGFYLIGLRSLHEEIFANVEWSSEKTFEQTVENITKINLKLFCLPLWFDVDLPENLVRLKNDLIKNPHTAPKTHQWLNENVF